MNTETKITLTEKIFKKYSYNDIRKNESHTRCLQKEIPYAPMVHYAAIRNKQYVK
jgi:hypothetical protein